jgi:hypothetical protein
MNNERLVIHPENQKLCRELACVFCGTVLFCSAFVIIFLGIIDDEINNGNSTIDMDLNG